MSKIWIVDDDDSLRTVMSRALEREGLSVRAFASADEVMQAFTESTPSVLLSDIRMPGASGIELLEWVRDYHPQIPVLITTAYSDLGSAVDAFRGGAYEYLPKPVDLDHLVQVVQRALEDNLGDPSSDENERNLARNSGIVGGSKAMQKVFRSIGRLAQSNTSVLISGASGSGKERVAQALHNSSTRNAGPFVPINMAAVPHDLLESELFGHERGAFTGADEQHKGKFELADGGTLFLDEIGDMPLRAQTRLLRVLSEGEFYRVGGRQLIAVNVRIISASHQDLQALVKNDEFREDLFYRLAVVQIYIPPLCERGEDIPALINLFLRQIAERDGAQVPTLSPEAMKVLCNHPWPGNVRQLQNACEWLVAMAPHTHVLPKELPPDVLEQSDDTLWQHSFVQWARPYLERRAMGGNVIDALAQQLIQEALKLSDGNRAEAAQLLGISLEAMDKIEAQ